MHRTLLSFTALGLLSIGCGRDAEPVPVSASDATPASTKAPESKNDSCCSTEESSTTPVVSVSAKPNDAVQIQSVKYNQLKDAVKAHKGKVVVVDVWATFCIPCMKEFPHLIELHQQLGKDGVVCISVSVDDPEKKEQALKFLQSKGADFQNFILDEDAEVWQNNWKVKGVPVVFVFGRDGIQAGKFDSDDPDKQFTYKDVRKRVEELLKK